MKHILTAFIIAVATIAGAEPPDVKVISATSVTVDKIDYGKPIDAIANNPALAPAIQRALETWAAEITTEKDVVVAKVSADKDKEVAKVIAEKDSALAKASAEKDKEVAKIIAEKDSAIAKVIAEKDSAIAKVTAEKDSAVAALAAKSSRIATVLEAKLNAELTTGDGPKAALIRELQAAAAKPAEDLRREALEAEITAKKAELEALTK